MDFKVDNIIHTNTMTVQLNKSNVLSVVQAFMLA